MNSAYSHLSESLETLKINSSVDLAPLKEFVSKEILSQSPRSFESFSLEPFEKLHRTGWMQAFIPEIYGGSGVSTVDLACMARCIAYGSAGIYTTVLANMLGMVPVLYHGSEALKCEVSERFLEKLELWSFAMTEPSTGSDVGRLKTKVEKVSGGYRLSGQKCFISNANYAKHLTVFAAHGDSANDRPPISVFYVPADSPGVSRGKPLQKLGQHDADTGELFFDDVFIPAEHRIGEEGDGLKIGFHSLQRSRGLIAAAGVGMCDRAEYLAVTELSTRQRYGKSLLTQPNIQSLLAQLHSEAFGAWLMALYAANTWDTGSQSLQYSSMAKMIGANTAVRFVNEVLELFGGYGYSAEYEIQRLYRDVKLLEIYEGPTFIQQVIIARELYSSLLFQGKERRKKAA